MLVSRASLTSLNTRLGAAGSELVVEETRFRPNILISGDFEGFQEDRSVRLNVWLGFNTSVSDGLMSRSVTMCSAM